MDRAPALSHVESLISQMDAQDARVRELQDAVEAARRALEDAERALRAAQVQRHSARHNRRARLEAMRKALAGPGRVIAVVSFRGGRVELPGVLLSATAARATVLTEDGELEFDLKATTYRSAGSGRGDAAAYSINPADVK